MYKADNNLFIIISKSCAFDRSTRPEYSLLPFLASKYSTRYYHQESSASYCSPRFAFQAGAQSSTMSLCEWYAKRVVLLTGVTSELGRALLEKILRCLPDVRVYVVLRSQNGLNGEERLKKIFASPGYERYPPRVPSRVHLVPVNRAGRYRLCAR